MGIQSLQSSLCGRSLQVVVSIQGLILVPKPYFNEAGFEKQSGSQEGEQNAVLYNEQAFLLTVRSAIYLLARPPAGFQGFVKASSCPFVKSSRREATQ